MGPGGAEAAAHTAEHLFIRSLQTLGVDLTVHVVEQSGWSGKVKLRASRLDWGLVTSAMASTNRAIAADLPVQELTFPSVSEAVEKFPKLRAREDRLGRTVTVIAIGDFDWATCAHSHAGSTGEASLFLVTDLHSLTGGSFEVSFACGEEALDGVGALVRDRARAADILNAKKGEVSQAAVRVTAAFEDAKKAVRGLTSKLVRGLPSDRTVTGARFFSADLGDVASKVLLSEVGLAIQNPRTAYVISYRQEGVPFVLVARSADLAFDCAEMVRRTLACLGGKGGGEPAFAMGGGPGVDAVAAASELAKEVRARLRENT
jgi:alanyl-tRNA synthetase